MLIAGIANEAHDAGLNQPGISIRDVENNFC
jgi:hypothetical protein